MLDWNVAILHPSERLKSLPKRSDTGLYFRIVLRERMQEHDASHALGALRPRLKRPRRRAAQQRDELAALHSITSSASARSVAGISRPSAFAVFRLMTNSNLVACITGRSAGFSPLRTRPV